VNDHSESLRLLARQMAAVSDSGELLQILCSAAMEHCGGSASAVVRAAGDTGLLIAAAGGLAPGLNRRFPMRGSLLREMITTRDIVAVDDVTATRRPLATVVPEMRMGPLMVAPLIAHDAFMGGIAVARDSGAASFNEDERDRLRTVADHAALALWKAELLEQAQSADRAKSRFLATISHELRTPLTALAGYGELLADEVLGAMTEAQQDVLERMRAVTLHLTALIEEVLTYSSLEVGQEVVRPTEFLVADLVRAAAAVIEPLVRQKHLALHVELPEASERMVADVDKLRQLLVNLLGNAVKFTAQGQVGLAVVVTADDVRFRIHDTGMGIAPADHERIFEPFMQLDAGLTRRYGGTGLGLYVARRLAELLGGRIDVESTPGAGSTFTVTMPRQGRPEG
jgi:signal transduction histidine kinase